MFHVYGHLDDILSWDELTVEEQVNVEADKLAETSLLMVIAQNHFIYRIFPNEDMVVMVDDKKISGSVCPAITWQWGDKIVREHYHENGIVHRNMFPLVY